MADYEDFDYNKPMSVRIWKKMLPFIGPQRQYLIRCGALMLCVAAIDVIYPLLLGYAVRNNIVPRSTEGMGKLLAAALILPAIQGLFVRFFVASGLTVEVSISRALRNAIFLHLQKLDLSYYNKTPVGYMMARTNSDTSRIGELVAWGLIDFSWSVFYCVGVIISMFLVHWRLALVVCATIPPLAVLTWIFQNKILVVNRIVRKFNSKITGAMNEGITGARTVKVLVTEEQSLREYGKITGEYRRYANHLAFLRAVFIPLVLFVGSLATAFILGYGGYEILILGADLSILAIFLQYAGGFFDPVQNIANILTELVSTQANVERVSGLLEQIPAITDRPEVTKKYGDTFSPKRENWEPIRGEIEFRNVTFRYPDGGENILEHFNLYVAAGTYVAIVGETGAGKSTLVNLVCRFFEPTRGEILVDGRDYRDRSQLWLHSALGYVLQSPHLFTGTIRSNIRYGRPEATDEEVEAAARIVHADRTIAKLEKGFDTEVGEGGDRLSTGEKQLISFARAVLANPRIFILDEATSSVDTEMEMLLQHAISRLLEGRTSFVIAHRLSTIRGADIILVVHGGKIIERGTHRELMTAGGAYYELYTRQFEEEAEEQVLLGH
ncbi:MAG: ABC transporter ATP-binding protein/permease [Spirochaetaceae bacterium]|jgi:ATP-binding cassette subfamily B protein|nr:ABC transporter ATP-binding protein/permease [Spirochaetaceae bacterium]